MISFSGSAVGPARDLADPAGWVGAEAGQAARLARVAARLGALDERLRRGPGGWRQRLALAEAGDLGWVLGVRVGPDRLALWLALRLAGAQADTAALARLAWAVRRLSGGPGPEAGLAAFLDRRDPGMPAAAGRHAPDRPDDPSADPSPDPLGHRAADWGALLAAAGALHPVSRACMGYHLWARAGLARPGDRLEAAVTAARLAAGRGGGAVFAPLALGGAGAALHASGPPAGRLAGWLAGMEAACRAAMRLLDGVEAWAARAEAATAPLSGRTPRALCRVLGEWPLVSAPMAAALTGASRAAVQRNLAWMEARGLIREVTGQGRFRMWRIA